MSKVITDSNFETEVLKNNQLVVVDFWCDWCGPCKQIAPAIDELSTEFDGKANIGKLNADENPNSTVKYNIRSIPAILFFKNGEVIDKVIGSTTKNALKEKISQHLS